MTNADTADPQGGGGVSEGEPVEGAADISEEEFENFGRLWVAYHPRLVAYIHARAPHLDSEDLASAVLESTMNALRRGKGPRRALRAYLFTAARARITRENDLLRRLEEAKSIVEQRRDMRSYQDILIGSALLDEVLATFSNRDRILLTEVVGQGAALNSVADKLRMTPAAASRRLYKAKRQLRSRWIQCHVDMTSAPPSCREVLRETGAVAAGLATEKSSQNFWDHVDSCDVCTPIVREATSSSRTLMTLIPAMTTGSGAAAVGVTGSQRRSRRRTKTSSKPVRIAIAVGLPTVAFAAALALQVALSAPQTADSLSGDSESGTVPSSAPERSSQAIPTTLGPTVSTEQGRVLDPPSALSLPDALRGWPDSGELRQCSWSADVLCNVP